MPKLKKNKISPGFSGKISREEFFSLPRVEFLVNEQNRNSFEEIDKMVLNNSMEIPDRFSMTVPDNRMADAGIGKGDYVVIQKQHNYQDGDILAVRLGEQAFIRRYVPSVNRIRLECNTPDRQSMILDIHTPGFSILGCVVQVIKEL